MNISWVIVAWGGSLTSHISKLVGKRIADRYCITGEIGVGGMGRVYRAMPFDDPSHDVAIKVIQRQRTLNPEDLLRFQKEAALMSRLHHPNIICFHELGLLEGEDKENGDLGNGYYIVMEIANGINLKQSLEKDGRKDLPFFFQVALRVTSALDYTHGKNIIHRDIKPQNIIVGRAIQDQRGLNVKILDFGVARLAEAMHFSSTGEKNAKAFQDVAGTPLYMAPEQTHLMDAPVDHRVDLYSLGCVLYEVLAGRPPFTAGTREKLEKQHVYSNPEPLTSLRPDIPPVIEEIVHKLLQKHPEDRYQSAFGLQSDLLRAKRRLDRRERPSSIAFPLGLVDRFNSVSAKLPLVGRRKEFQSLVSNYEATALEKGRSRLTVVQGVSGSGKTRLLAEFRNYLAKRKIRFISANFSQHENALPFNALANGFNDYLNRVVKSQPHEAEELRRKVKALLGPTAYQVAEVVPGLMPFITEDIEGPGDEDTDDGSFQNFSKAFSDFTRCIAVDNQPVVFIFDDLHWADEKSIELIDQFFSHNNSQRFYMVVGHRLNDPMITPRFSVFLEKFRKLRRRFDQVELLPFSESATKEMTENILADKGGVSDTLVDYLQTRTHGSPMHIVEAVRALVSRDLIRLKARDGDWIFDEAEILSSNLRFRSVDLVLSRILDLQQTDREILEVAATLGMTFQFEMLLIDGRKDSVRVMNILQKAMEDGLVSRIPDDAELVHLGKTYSFTHWRVREIIYQNISRDRRMLLHEAVIDKLESSVDTLSPKMVFALAHHVNRALEHGRAHSESLAMRCIDFNIMAGKEAMAADSWQSAQRYFENAYQQMDYWPTDSELQIHRPLVVEHMADLAALLRRHGEALRRYDELATYPLDNSTFAALAFKKVHLQLQGGIISKSIKFTTHYLTSLLYPVPKGRLWEYGSLVWELLIDLVPQNPNRHRLHRMLKKAHSDHVKKKTDLERKYIGARLYSLGQQLSLQSRPKFALLFHNFLFKVAQKGGASPLTMVRVIGERAVLFGYMGFSRLAYTIMDQAMDLSKALGDRNGYGYLCLLRALVLDYVRDKEDEVKGNLRTAMRYLAKDEDRVSYGVGLEYKIFRELMRGNLSAVTSFALRVPEHVQTRNWISPRCMGMMFYGLLLADSRDEIVRRGETYLRRREEVAGRPNDVFVLIIQVMVTFARGDTEKTRSFYADAMKEFLKGHDEFFLFPFEEDFVGLFAYTFPVMFEQEHRRRLMRDEELHSIYKLLYKRVHRIVGVRRGVTSLICARAREIIGKGGVKELYDDALKSSKIAGHQLVLVFTHLWFGDHLLSLGVRNRNEYLRRAHKGAGSLQLTALVEYIEKQMEARKIQYKKAVVKQRASKVRTRYGNFRSRLIFEHIDHLADVLKLDTSLEQNLEESLAILEREYRCERIVCILSGEADGDASRILMPFDLTTSQEEEISSYVSPYLQIRSTLFLPATDAPWVSAHQYHGHRSMTVGHHTNTSEDVEATIAVDSEQEKTQPVQKVEYSFGQTQAQNPANITIAHESGSELPPRSLQMSALVPIRYGERNCGVLLLEDVDLTNKETTSCRTELDHIGSQLGLLVEKKSNPAAAGGDPFSDAVALTHAPGSYTLEEVPWIRFWNHGKLRASRESTWYLGLRIGSGHYFLAYCRLNGPQEIREKLSAVLWYQLLALRTLLVSSGRSDFDLSELKEEITSQLRCFPTAKGLENVSLSFTLFDKVNEAASSGHLGPSRPLVLCQENLVTPDNRVVLTLNNGRDLRYWSVEASTRGPHAYILPHDSSKLDTRPSDSQRRSLATSLLDTSVRKELNLLMERLILKENLPRYYVGGVVLNEEWEGRQAG